MTDTMPLDGMRLYPIAPGRPMPPNLPRPQTEHWDWQRHACCRARPELFFGPDTATESPAARARREDQAKQICRPCPVVGDCRSHALRAPESHGVWGATTPIERARILDTARKSTVAAR